MTCIVTENCSLVNVSVASWKLTRCWTGGQCNSFAMGVIMFILINLAAAFCNRGCK